MCNKMHAFVGGHEAYLQCYLLLIYRLSSAFRMFFLLGFRFTLWQNLCASLLYSFIHSFIHSLFQARGP